MFKQWYKPTHYHAFLILNTFMVLISIKLDLELHSNADVSRCYRLNKQNSLPKMTLLTVAFMFSRRITIATAPIKGPNIWIVSGIQLYFSKFSCLGSILSAIIITIPKLNSAVKTAMWVTRSRIGLLLLEILIIWVFLPRKLWLAWILSKQSLLFVPSCMGRSFLCVLTW